MGSSLGIGGIVAAGQAFLETNPGNALLDTVLLRPTRGFYTGRDPKNSTGLGQILVLPDVVVRESHRDSLQLTSHPVERGANVNDHLYRQPSEVSIIMGFANTLVGLFSPDINTGTPRTQPTTPVPLEIA